MRSASQRRADALLRLEQDANVWIATSSADGQPHLVPLSLAWDGRRILVATPSVTPTARNAAATGVCKASLDSAEDVVLIDADVEVVDFASVDPDTTARYVERVGWNPADEAGEWSLLIVEPRTVRAWNSVDEISGRTIMRQGQWSDGSATAEPASEQAGYHRPAGDAIP
jgi:hypothetical protein